MLDKNENEPVDIYVNEILIARGLVVAIEDTYGVKITEIINNNDNKLENK
jgi:flagellar motor switch protein FliN/FliY